MLLKNLKYLETGLFNVRYRIVLNLHQLEDSILFLVLLFCRYLIILKIFLKRSAGSQTHSLTFLQVFDRDRIIFGLILYIPYP